MISYDEIQYYLRIALEHTKRLGFDGVPHLTKDLYWSFDSERFNMNQRPQPLVGSLIDDVAELKKLQNDPDRATSVDLQRIAAVLQYISSEVSDDRDGS